MLEGGEGHECVVDGTADDAEPAQLSRPGLRGGRAEQEGLGEPDPEEVRRVLRGKPEVTRQPGEDRIRLGQRMAAQPRYPARSLRSKTRLAWSTVASMGRRYQLFPNQGWRASYRSGLASTFPGMSVGTRVLLVSAGLLIVVAGVVFALQGVGVIGGSFMSGTSTWAVAGPLIALAGLVVAGFGLRPRRSRPRRH